MGEREWQKKEEGALALAPLSYSLLHWNIVDLFNTAANIRCFSAGPIGNLTIIRVFWWFQQPQTFLKK